MNEWLDAARLQDEAQALYRTLFDRPAPPVLVERFLPVSQTLNARVSAADVAAYYRALAAEEDLEALEFAARFTHRLPLLTRKLQAMVVLAETLPENQSVYINSHSSWLGGVWAAGWATVRSVWLAGKGWRLLRGGRYA